MRYFTQQLASSSLIETLMNCQIGRVTLLIGCTLFVRCFQNLPGIAVFYIVWIYGTGTYSLAFSASSNLFP